MGYYRAGFDVVGLDNRPQPRYPFQFVQGDALRPPFDLRNFDAIHASPPCQEYTKARLMHPRKHLDHVAAVRRMLMASGKPYVIENVPGAPLECPIELCGCMFGLAVNRRRLFETSFALLGPPHLRGHGPRSLLKTAPRGIYDRGQGGLVTVAGNNFCPVAGGKAMGIDWMIGKELSQAIPPAYCEYIGKRILEHLESA